MGTVGDLYGWSGIGVGYVGAVWCGACVEVMAGGASIDDSCVVCVVGFGWDYSWI
jgi:hypothetical protein